jgi:transcription elongation GreA/GreB family factor
MIDDLKLPENEVGPGTMVVLEQIGTGEHHTHWLLGEGDDVYGSEVLSYASPLGRELLGKKVSERITLLRSDGAVEFVIKSVNRRLPDEAHSATRS